MFRAYNLTVFVDIDHKNLQIIFRNALLTNQTHNVSALTIIWLFLYSYTWCNCRFRTKNTYSICGIEREGTAGECISSIFLNSCYCDNYIKMFRLLKYINVLHDKIIAKDVKKSLSRSWSYIVRRRGYFNGEVLCFQYLSRQLFLENHVCTFKSKWNLI